MTARHSPLFTLESGQSGLGFYTSQRDAAWENGFAESFNGRFRDEFLNTELFTTAPEAQLLADRWRWEYNTFRPHSALQGRTPLEAAQQGAAA
jgi:transposase InsO family protein